jgi:hypothetical protein
MNPLRLGLPPEVAPLVASVKRSSAPPEAARDELRARLGWAFVETGAAKVIYAPEHRPLRAVPARREAAPPTNNWFLYTARAAAAMVLGHVPLALASLGVAVAVVPISRIVLNRVAKDRGADHSVASGTHSVAHRASPSAAPHAPSILVLPSLPPPPAPFPVEEPVVPVPQNTAQPIAAAPVAPRLPAEIPNDDSALAAERQLLQQARRALVRGDALGALASLDEHGARYPSSQLAEEREALSVQALLRAGRTGEARVRGIEFRRQYPNSLLLRALGEALHE